MGPSGIRIGEWRSLYSGERHSLYRSPNIVRDIKSKILGWAVHVARMEEGSNAFNILTGKPVVEMEGKY